MQISVIIASYAKPFHLERALHGYAAQSDTNFDIIVTEDGNLSEIAEVVKSVKEKTDLSIQHLTQDDTGFRKTVALNHAINAAQGDYLIFTDDDCIPRNDVVAVHRKYAKPNQHIVGAYNRLPLEVSRRITIEDVVSQRAFSLAWLFGKGYRPTRGFLRMIIPRWLGNIMDLRGPLDPGRFPGGHSSCNKQDAIDVGGFDETMRYGLEDREFGTRLHHKGVIGRRIKNSTFMLHLEHSRPYCNMDEFYENKKILQKTKETGRIIAGHLEK